MKKKIEMILRKIRLYDKVQSMRSKRNHRKLLCMEAKINLDSLSSNDVKRIEHMLRIKIHHMEKMLAIGELTATVNDKICFGILSDIEKCLEYGKGIQDNAIIESLSVINCYIGICEENEIDCSEVKSRMEQLLQGFSAGKSISEYTVIEIITATKSEVQSSSRISIDGYKEHLCNRVSIRESKPILIEKSIIRDIIAKANLCPSAANRQPCKVYYSVDRDMQDRLKALCGDKQVSSNLYNFMVPTVDKTMFSSSEPFQAWLSGGIFVDSLVNSIHSLNLCSCLFQTFKGSKNSQKIKQLLEIPDNEDILCVVGFGEYPDSVRYIKKHRKPIDSIAIER